MPQTAARTGTRRPAKQAARLLEKSGAVCIGCGVGDGDVLPLVRAALRSGLPVVLDRGRAEPDGEVQATAGHAAFQTSCSRRIRSVEMARLCGESAEAILADPIDVARRYAQQWNCVVLLKGATSCVSSGGESPPQHQRKSRSRQKEAAGMCSPA